MIDKCCSVLLLWIFAKILGNYHLCSLVIVICDVGKVPKINGKIVKLFQMQ